MFNVKDAAGTTIKKASDLVNTDEHRDEVKITSSTLPTGAATSAAQTTAQTSLSAIAVSVAAATPAGTNNIGDVDVLSVIPGTAATNLGKAEDAAHASGDTGVMALVVRRDADTTLVGADGDYAPLQVNAVGALKVTGISGGSGLTAQETANSMGLLPAVVSAGSLVDKITDVETALTAGTVVTGTAGSAGADVLTVQGIASMTPILTTSTVSSVVPGTAATNLGKAEDAAHASGDTGVMALVVRRDADTTLVATDGDYAPLQVNAAGALKVSGAGGGQQYAEDTAHVTADLGTMVLAVRNDAGTALAGATGDYIPLTTDSTGALRINGYIAADSPLPVTPDGVFLVSAGGLTTVPSASSTVTRPADTTAYAVGDLIANSVTAGSVAALQFTAARISGGSGVVVGARVQKTGTTFTSYAMRLHLFQTVPTFTSAGDNTAMSTVVQANAKGYLGYIDIPSFVGFADSAWGTGAPDNYRSGLPFVATAQIIYGVLEARGAFTPTSAEVYTVSLMVLQD